MKYRFSFFALILILSHCASAFQKQSSEADWPKLTQVEQEILKPTRWDIGDTTVSNEDRLDLLIPHVKNLGNVYLGVGSEQNLTLAAWAKSDFIYLMDFTQVVVSANQMMVMFLKESPNKEVFLSRYKKENQAESFALIEKNLPNPNHYKQIFTNTLKFVKKRHRTNKITSDLYNYKMFQTDDEQYAYIRNLALQGRIFPVKGSLLGDITLNSIGDTLKKTGRTIGVLYFSNAEEYFKYPPSFIRSIKNLPVNESSLVVRTISVKQNKFPWSPGSDLSTSIGFHYCVQKVNNFQVWLSQPRTLRSDIIMEEGGEVDKKNGITIVTGLPKS
ncbi:hypothetical protein LPTSP4_15760 [Leptospira ryugenii]|uniref:DUF7790 domain-containing protein n=1 Tax=Leptospira ryugenii TaxID=1917863 RepID=A0A2P2DZK3_9LEPT|nr:hypothetical protein LPTSP4_15760 [Leptospira ryugenii]